MYPKLDEKKVVFITEPCMFRGYTGTRMNAVTQVYPIQAYLWLSAWLKKLGLKTAVLDMGIITPQKAWFKLVEFLLEEKPKYIGMTVTTPLFYDAKLIGIVAKEVLGPDVVIVHGGVHASALPEESLVESMCDIVVIGEGELTLGEVCEGRPWNEIRGIAYREDDGRRTTLTAQQIISRLLKGEPTYNVQLGAVIGPGEPKIVRNPSRPYMSNQELDDLPFPDLDLYDIWKYKNPRIFSRAHPLIQYETSRGCPFRCNFCSAENAYRIISPDRVIETLKFFQKRGVRELRISDDQFLVNLKRGKIIIEKMIQSGLDFKVNLGNGVRADRCDEEFLRLAKRAGFYSIGAGFESGDQEALDSLGKSLDLEKSLRCAEMIKKIGIEVVGFFMIGAPADTIKSMQRTINFAKMLMPDLAKVTICIPFPDTELFRIYDRQGLILSRNWADYNIHRSVGVYRHPNPDLTPEVLCYWYNKFYRDFYFNPRYMLWKSLKSVRDGSIFRNAYYGAKTFFPNLIPGDPTKNVK